MIRKTLFLLFCLMLVPTMAVAVEMYHNGDISLNIGYWGQVWYQYVRDYDRDSDGAWGDSLNDFMIRRSYFNVNAAVTPRLNFFMHYAADRIGQEGLDKPGAGLGSGLAVRDAWVAYKILDNDLIVQI